MLVLSRRPNQKVVFPNLGISVQVIRVDGKAVRLGIEAPSEIRVLRDELADQEFGKDSELGSIRSFLSGRQIHKLRNRLNTACLGLQLLRRRLELGQVDGQTAETAICDILQDLRELDTNLQPRREPNEPAVETPARCALIVEDNANESELLATLLRMNGYWVDTVDDGLQALAYLRQSQRPDAVLLDMCMPRLDGPKTVTSIRCEPDFQGLKLFAVSGASREDMGVDIGPCGVDRWFAKPVDASQLVTEMNRELGQAAAAS